MSESELRLYYASILYDIDALYKNPLKSDKLHLNKRRNCDIITSLNLIERMRNEAISILLNEGVPYHTSEKGDVITINGSDFFFDINNIKEVGYRVEASLKDGEFLEIENFPLRANVFLNDVYKTYEEEQRDEPMVTPQPEVHIRKEPEPVEKAEEPIQSDAAEDGIRVNKLIMNAYSISYPDKDGDKVMTVITAPLVFPPGNSFSVPIFVIAKKDGKIATTASPPDMRASVLLSVGGESVTLKGTWSDNKFKTFVYPQKAQGREIKIIKREYAPDFPDGDIGHYVKKGKDEIHVLPMATKNNQEGYVQFIACVREPIKDGKYRNTVAIASEGKELKIKGYTISCRWDGELLKVSVKQT